MFAGDEAGEKILSILPSSHTTPMRAARRLAVAGLLVALAIPGLNAGKPHGKSECARVPLLFRCCVCSCCLCARAASRRGSEALLRPASAEGALPAVCCSFVVAPVWPYFGSCLPPAPGSCKQGGKRGESATRLLPQTALAGPALWVKCWVKCWQRVRTLPPRVHVCARMRACAYVSDVRWTLVRGC